MNNIIIAIFLMLSQKQTSTQTIKPTSSFGNISVYQQKYNVYQFTPKENITTYELAKILTVLYGGDIEKLFKELPSVERHFTKIK